MPRNKWQWKHDNSKPVGWIKAMLRGKLTAIQTYLKKQEKQLKNLTSHLKQLVKKIKKKPKSVEEINHKDQSLNKWKRSEGDNNKDK